MASNAHGKNSNNFLKIVPLRQLTQPASVILVFFFFVILLFVSFVDVADFSPDTLIEASDFHIDLIAFLLYFSLL